MSNTCTQLTTENGITVPLILFAIVIILYFFGRKGNYKICLMVVSSILYAVFITHTQPTAEGRYLWSSSILLLIAFIYVLMEDICLLMPNNNPPVRIRAMSCCLVVFLAADICKSIDPGNIAYLRWRPEAQELAVKQETDCPWIIFYDNVDWIFMCSMYDFITPRAVKRVGTQTPGEYDKIIQEADKVIVYTNESVKNIEQCIQYLEASCDKQIAEYELISSNYLLSVYCVMLK